MATIESLEIQMSSVIRTGLREAMQSIDVADLQDPLHAVIRVLESCLYDSLYAETLTTYTEGYADGASQIKQAKEMALGDASDESMIAVDLTAAEIQRLETLLSEHTDVIREIVRTEIEQGATMPQIAAELGGYFDDNPAYAMRFARTAVNDIYNGARINKYRDSGVVDGVEYSAHIDDLTSDACQMLDGTIWKLDDSGIRRPPLHFNCRSNILPYFGKIPGGRDYEGEFGAAFVGEVDSAIATFQTKYWTHIDSKALEMIVVGVEGISKRML